MSSTESVMVAFGEVAGPPWDDKPTFIVGGGPSLRGFDFAKLRGLGHVVGVNQSMFDAPADIGVTMDHAFMQHRRSQLETFAASRRALYLVMPSRWECIVAPIAGATYLLGLPHEGLSLYTDEVRHGGTSGYAALNIAILKRAAMIVLLGFDYSGDAGAFNYHRSYSWGSANEALWPIWARRFDAAAQVCRALGVEVINASPTSAVTSFPVDTIDGALKKCRRS